tara:strand:+ start:1239 stop:1883 length:645 start_codon:yes stop_codon:yes gene_type:complete
MKFSKILFLVFFSLFLSLNIKAKNLILPKVTAEYVCNTNFLIGVSQLQTRTFQGKNKKRIDTIVDNVPQSIIINYDSQTVTWIWPRTFAYLTVPLNKKNQENLKKSTNISKLEKKKTDYIGGFEVNIYDVKLSLPDGTIEESERWITKQHGITLKETGVIIGNEGKIHFYSEYSNVKVFKQDEKLFEVPEGYKIAPIEDLDDVNELLKTMVKRV